MKIDYFFPIFAEDNAKNFFSKFFKTKFFQEYSSIKKEDKKAASKENKKEKQVKENKPEEKLESYENNFYFVCGKEDKNNLEYLSSQALLHPEFKIFVVDKNFSYNDAFAIALNSFKGDIVLLGDLKIAKLDLVFEKCMQKKEKCNMVHVVKRRDGFKGFFKNLFIKTYNFFIKLFTGKNDRFNVISLGLIDKHIIQLLQVLPNKSCYLKNTKELKGFETRSIYIDPKTKTYKKSFRTMTSSLIISISATASFSALLLAIILLNVFLSVAPAFNILMAMGMFLCIILNTLFLPKHIFDIRNAKDKNFSFDIKEIN